MQYPNNKCAVQIWVIEYYSYTCIYKISRLAANGHAVYGLPLLDIPQATVFLREWAMIVALRQKLNRSIKISAILVYLAVLCMYPSFILRLFVCFFC